jgi:hypothetical protein
MVYWPREEKQDSAWLLNKYELCLNRYMKAENFICDIIDMPWYKLLFIRKKALRFIENTLKQEKEK